jgi:hypothetical protein
VTGAVPYEGFGTVAAVWWRCDGCSLPADVAIPSTLLATCVVYSQIGMTSVPLDSSRVEELRADPAVRASKSGIILVSPQTDWVSPPD